MTHEEQAGKISEQAHMVGEMSAQALIAKVTSDGLPMPVAINVVSILAIGVVHSLAALVAKQGDPRSEDFNPEKGITPEALLFAVLLVNKIAPEHDAKSHGIHTEFSPFVIFEAMEAYEKLTGKQPDLYLNPQMVKAAREAGSQGKELFNALVASRKQNPGSSASIH